MSETQTLTAARTPTVYFIDDSATMREVIKIAFRKENINVITCADAASALAQFGDSAPDAVITDVIMPDKDGYEVCQFIKEHERFGKTPVILMSGVVNRTVAERAMQVRADELVRKPFQPQDLIARVKSLLNPAAAGAAARGSLREEDTNSSQAASRVLSGLFSPPSVQQNGALSHGAAPYAASANFAPPNFAPSAPATTSAWPAEPAQTFAPRPSAATQRSAPPTASSAPPQRAAVPTSAEAQKLRHEIRRLELLVKKLQAELEAQKQYCAALEADFKSVQETE
ncbi:MAG TPA: response regulator [Candidatus Acidoferrales bacterium]|jgi:CheY-like chemotaxis protein|nr:response regulator [Candidatus Acidoferrales bacterium]